MSEQVKHKMQNLEIAPPPGAWDFIAAQLDQNAVQQKMNQLEITPPAFAWKEIEKELDKNAEKVIPISRNKKIIYLRYAAVAVFIGLIATGITLYFNNTKTIKHTGSPTETAANVDNQPKGNAAINNVSDSDNTQAPVTTTNTSSTPYTSSRLPLETQNEEGYKDVLAYNEFPLQKASTDEISYADLYNPNEGVNMVARDLNGNGADGINAVSADENHFITNGPNGDVVRVSNKLSNIIPLLSDDNTTQEYLDVVIKESAVWKQRYDNLRNKLSKIAPSPNNFLDIIQLASVLNEAKKP